MKSLLQQSSQLSRLLEQTQMYQALLELGQTELPEKLASHLIGVSFEAQTLILQIDDNLWSTKLRFHEPELLEIYQTHFPHLSLNQTNIRVLPIAERRPPKKLPVMPPDENTARDFLVLSEKVENEQLKQTLKKLSQRGLPPSTN